MVDIIGGNGPVLPSGDGGRLGAAVREVSPRLYLLSFGVLHRFAGIELVSSRPRKWFGKTDCNVRTTDVSRNPDNVLTQLVSRAAPVRGDPVPACLQQLPEGETHDGSTTIGRSRYLLMFPTLRLTVGLSFKIVATKGNPTTYTLRATAPYNDPNQIMGELYALDSTMRILITGGCGFLGHHLVEHFLRTTDHDLVVLDKLTYASNGFDRLRDIDAFDDRRVHVIGCDLSHPIPAGVAQEIGPVDYVIHTAAETHVDNSIVDPLPFLQSNVIGTHHLLWWIKERAILPSAIRRIFLVSTDEVYGPAPQDDGFIGFDETAPFRPANPYAAAKAGGECVAMAYANTYRLPVTIVNTMNLIGERQHVEKFVPMVIRKVLLGERVTIHADATRTIPGTRFYLHARTFANALAWMIEDWGSKLGNPQKIHVCGEREIDNLDLAKKIAGYVGKPLSYELTDFHSSRPGHDLRYAMSDRLVRDLGWVRPMGIEDSLRKTVAWYCANPKWLGLRGCVVCGKVLSLDRRCPDAACASYARNPDPLLKDHR